MRKEVSIRKIRQISSKIEMFNNKSKELTGEFNVMFKGVNDEGNVLYNNLSRVRLRKKLSFLNKLSTEIRKDLQFLNEDK